MQQLRNILIMKFGGTSVGSTDAMKQVLEIIHRSAPEQARLVVVTSALSGITDLLLKSTHQAASGQPGAAEDAAGQITRRHAEMVKSLVANPERQNAILWEIDGLVSSFLGTCREIGRQGEASPRSLDAIAGFGERLAVRVLAGALEASGLAAKGVEATQLIVTDDHFTNAEPDVEATRQKARQALDPLLAKGVIPVVTGYIAATRERIPTTLGRGGSDYSAAILAAALGARETWIWTDVDGVMTADPRLIPEARTIPQLSYDEVAEMARLGAKVLHPKTIQPILKTGGTLRVRNTFNPEHPGTLLVKSNGSNQTRQTFVKAVTVLRGQSWGRIAQEEMRWKKSAGEEADMLTVICPGLRSSPGVKGQVFNALEQARIKILASSYSASDISINLFIGSGDTQNAMRILHGLIR